MEQEKTITQQQTARELQRRTEQLEALQRVSLKLTAQLDVDDLLYTIAAQAITLLEANAGVLYLYNEATNQLDLRVSVGPNAPPVGEFLELGEGISGKVWQTGKSIIVDDYKQWLGHASRYEVYPLHAVVGVPIYWANPMGNANDDNKYLGVIDVLADAPRTFTKEDAELLSMFATQAAIALRNARLYDETRRREHEQATLRNAMIALTTTFNCDEVVDRILAQLQEVVPYDTASIQLFRGNQLEIVGGRGFPNLEKLLGIRFDPSKSENPNYEVVQQRCTFICGDVDTHYEEFHKPPHNVAGIRSWMGVPMFIGDTMLGMIALDKQKQNFYTAHHAQLTEAFAAQAAIAIENSRLFKAEQEQRELAERLQETAFLINSSLNLQKVLELILEQMARVVPYDSASIQEYVHTTDIKHRYPKGVTRVIAMHGLPDHIIGHEFPLEVHDYSRRLIEETDLIVIDEAQNNDYGFITTLADNITIHANMGVRLSVRNEVIGILTIDNQTPGAYDKNHTQIARIFAQQAAIAIDNARMHKKVVDYAEEQEQQVIKRTIELQKQTAQRDAILHSATDGIVVTYPDGTIKEMNPIAQNWLTQSLSTEESTRLRNAIQNIAQQSSQGSEIAYSATEYLELTGLDLELRGARIRPTQDQTNTHHDIVVVIHDISHLKAMERVKNSFIRDISHEMRTPIATVSSYLHLLKMMPDKITAYIDPLLKEVKHQADLIQDIVEISQLDAGKFELQPHAISLNTLVANIVGGYEQQSKEKNLYVNVQLAPTSPQALVDDQRITQALNHLFKNALTYTSNGDTITITTNNNNKNTREWAVVTIRDTGTGIPEDELPHIFERFFRGKEPREQQVSGTGLGLPIVKAIVDLHGGDITIDSTLGAGTAISLWLPVAN